MTDPIYALSRQINQVGAAVGHIASVQDALQSSVQQVSDAQEQTTSELRDLAGAFAEYVLKDQLQHNVQVAHAEIVEVNMELEKNFGHFNQVRRLATGTLQALDTGITSHGTMRQLSEELMLLTPGYWLAPALVAFAAWTRDDQRLALRALQETTRRDNDKAALFFALVLRRMRRDGATARWLAQYVSRQDPKRLSPEFMVILDSVAVGAFGNQPKTVVMTQLDTWYQRLVDEQGIVDQQVARWVELLGRDRGSVDPRYRILPKISSTWPALKTLYEGATVHERAIERFRAIFSGPLNAPEDLARRIDEILWKLVKDYDAEEAPLRHKELELQEIVKAGGDKSAAADAVRLAFPLHEQTVDFLSMVSNAAFDPAAANVSAGTQRFAIALAKDWIGQAIGRLEAQNAASEPAQVRLDVEGWQGSVDGSTSEEQLVARLTEHIAAETEAAVARVRFAGKLVGYAVTSGVLLLCALWAGLAGGVVFGALLLIGAAVTGFLAGAGGADLPNRRAEIRRRGEERTEVAVAELRGGIAELIDLRGDWQRELAFAATARTYLDGLDATAYIGRAPDAKRGM